MALKEIKYNNTTIYIDDEISDEHKGFALDNKNKFEETQVLNLKDELDLLDDTQEFKFDNLEDTIIMKPIGEENESNYFVLLFAKICKAPLAIMRVLPPMHLSAVVQLTFYQEWVAENLSQTIRQSSVPLPEHVFHQKHNLHRSQPSVRRGMARAVMRSIGYSQSLCLSLRIPPGQQLVRESPPFQQILQQVRNSHGGSCVP